MEPPAKKLRPYVTKWERKKAAENAIVVDEASVDHSNIKELFISNETVLEYQDKHHRCALPR